MDKTSTGIVRRIDDLGRVVIPKELRRTVGIKEGDPMEIFVGRDEKGRPEITFRRYIEGDELEYLKNIVNSLDNFEDSFTPGRKQFKADLMMLIMDRIKVEKGMSY